MPGGTSSSSKTWIQMLWLGKRPCSSWVCVLPPQQEAKSVCPRCDWEWLREVQERHWPLTQVSGGAEWLNENLRCHISKYLSVGLLADFRS